MNLNVFLTGYQIVLNRIRWTPGLTVLNHMFLSWNPSSGRTALMSPFQTGPMNPCLTVRIELTFRSVCSGCLFCPAGYPADMFPNPSLLSWSPMNLSLTSLTVQMPLSLLLTVRLLLKISFFFS
jgi:hypothetical protein